MDKSPMDWSLHISLKLSQFPLLLSAGSALVTQAAGRDGKVSSAIIPATKRTLFPWPQ
jgi:hypothetical protein